MRQRITLASGAKVEISENGVIVTSTNGQKAVFDPNGKLKSPEELARFESFGSDLERQMRNFRYIGPDQYAVVKKWYEAQEMEAQKRGVPTKRSDNFLLVVGRALKALRIPQKPIMVAEQEPSLNDDGQLYYEPGMDVCCNLSYEEWYKKAREFAPQCESDVANLYEGIFYYALRVAEGSWSLSYICDDSSSAGNHADSPEASHVLEKSGERCVGGARDGVGNTRKLVSCGDAGIALLGTWWEGEGKQYPVAKVSYKPHHIGVVENTVAIVVLRNVE